MYILLNTHVNQTYICHNICLNQYIYIYVCKTSIRNIVYNLNNIPNWAYSCHHIKNIYVLNTYMFIIPFNLIQHRRQIN